MPRVPKSMTNHVALTILCYQVKNLLRKNVTDQLPSSASLSSSSGAGRLSGAAAVKMTPEELEKVRMSSIEWLCYALPQKFSVT
jgi:hypothetical protein